MPSAAIVATPVGGVVLVVMPVHVRRLFAVETHKLFELCLVTVDEIAAQRRVVR